MDILTGIKNLLLIINDNWALIICILGLLAGLIVKFKAWWQTSTEEKIANAKTQITEYMLKLVTDAEVEYADWVSAGQIKRSQVISEIYEQFPILEKVQSQDELLTWLDALIDNALDVLREVIDANVLLEGTDDSGDSMEAVSIDIEDAGSYTISCDAAAGTYITVDDGDTTAMG